MWTIFSIAEVKSFITEQAEQALSEECLNIKLEGVMGTFREQLRRMEQLDLEIETRALEILPEGCSPPNTNLRRDRGIIKIVWL